MSFITIPEAIEEIKNGNPLIILDSKRECEADFYLPAQAITPEHVMTMIRYGGGILLVALTQEQANNLDIPLMVPLHKNTESTKLNITISVNAKDGITTGVSAFDRAKTINLLANPNTTAEELTRPGHVSCLVANPGGLQQRTGHTEAAVDLAKLAGFSPAGVLCEIVGENGKMAALPELKKLSEKLGIKIILLHDLIEYVKQHPLQEQIKKTSVKKQATTSLPTEYGVFQLSIYTSLEDNQEHALLSMGEITEEPVLTRLHSQCFTGDTLLSLRCDCREQLHKSMQLIEKKGKGIILYLNQEGRGIGLINKIKAYALQEKGLDTIAANHALGLPTDARDYKPAADILHDLDITKIALLTNNPNKIKQLESYGITIVKRIPLEIAPNETNKQYLLVKKQKMGHLLTNV